MMHKMGPQKWIFDEVAKVSKTAFQFKEKSNPSSYASQVASDLHEVPRNEVLSRQYIM